MNRKDTQNIQNEQTITDGSDGGFSTNKNHDLVFKLVSCSLLIAMVVVLQVFSGNIRFGEFSVTLALIPIIVGAILFGPAIGALLGFIMGFIVLLMDSAAFYAINPFYTIIICIGKSTIAGLGTGLIYRALSKKNNKLGIILASLACPILNTGFFALGCIVFFFNTLKEWAGGTNALNYLFITMIGINFIFEFVVVSIISPSLVFLIKVLKEKANL